MQFKSKMVQQRIWFGLTQLAFSYHCSPSFDIYFTYLILVLKHNSEVGNKKVDVKKQDLNFGGLEKIIILHVTLCTGAEIIHRCTPVLTPLLKALFECYGIDIKCTSCYYCIHCITRLVCALLLKEVNNSMNSYQSSQK